MLELCDVSTFYGKIQALHTVSLAVRQGEIVTLIGCNGAGKSTLLMTLCGSPRAAGGSIRYLGEELVGQETCAIMRKGIAIVPEGRRVFARLSVEENLAMGGFFTAREDYQAQLERVLELFPRLKERFAQRAGTMSGGEQQMLAIGRALMARPRLLLLDEPSLGIAPKLVQQIFRAIAEIARSGVTILLVEQNTRIALATSQRAYVLRTGEIALEGDAKELASNPEIQAAYLGG